MDSNQEKISWNFLETCVRDYKMFIDTSSLLEPGAENFLQKIYSFLQRYGKSLIVPLSVCLELQKLAENPGYCREKYPDNPNLNKTAIRMFKRIMQMRDSKLVIVLGDKNDGDFADKVFINVFTNFRTKYNLLLITQDHDLAADIMQLKDSRAVRGVKKILVQRIDRNDFLQQVFDNRKPKFASIDAHESEEIPLNERFAFAREVTQIYGNLSVTKIPVEGDTVNIVRNNQQRQIRLLEKIGGGGEGYVYKTDLDGFVAKIYKPEKITRLRCEKLKLMLTKDINCAGVCFPLAIICNEYNEFVGYLMRAASGYNLDKCVFKPMLLKKYFPAWNRVDTVQLCVTILQKLKYLHDRNVILGDINPFNILVVSPTEVYFVDTDSWQVEGFVCPVGTPLFTAPELQNKESYGLRTLGNENFAVATLLFMIMHPGKPPYAMQDGEGIVENIIKGDFSYPFGELKTGKVPKGPWRFCWSHLTYQLKETFYHTFRYDGRLHDEKNRPSTGHWLRLFENYLELLKNGTMPAQDEEALLIFPTRLKKDRNKTYAKCKLCGREYEEDHLERGICRACLNDGDKYKCARCGREMLYTNYQKYIKKAKRYDICHDCYERKNTVWERRICKDCGRTFEITYGEKEFFDKKGFSLPTRCENCRGKSTYTPTQTYTPTYTPSPEPKKSGWCFITTAVCEYLGKPDDCFELTTLRNFRDNWLAFQPGGKAEIREYYEIAPRIVEKISASNEKDYIYEKIRLEYIEPCLEDILHGHNENCRDRYRAMVNMLKQKFLID